MKSEIISMGVFFMLLLSCGCLDNESTGDENQDTVNKVNDRAEETEETPESRPKGCDETLGWGECEEAGGVYQIYHTDDDNPTAVCNCFKSCGNNEDCLLKDKDGLKAYCQFDKECSGEGTCEIVETIDEIDKVNSCGDVPECGCDGKTYINRCQREQAQVSLKKRGGCSAQKECAEEGGYAKLSGPIEYQYSCCYNEPIKTENGLFCPSTMEDMPSINLGG